MTHGRLISTNIQKLLRSPQKMLKEIDPIRKITAAEKLLRTARENGEATLSESIAWRRQN